MSAAARLGTVFLLAFALQGCGAVALNSPPTAQTSVRALRASPSLRAMTRAFARVEEEARQCLGWGVSSVAVSGVFVGETGQFELLRSDGVNGAEVPFAVHLCLRTILERARVRPFLEEQASFTQSFSVPMRPEPAPLPEPARVVVAVRERVCPPQVVFESSGRAARDPQPRPSSAIPLE